MEILATINLYYIVCTQTDKISTNALTSFDRYIVSVGSFDRQIDSDPRQSLHDVVNVFNVVLIQLWAEKACKVLVFTS